MGKCCGGGIQMSFDDHGTQLCYWLYICFWLKTHTKLGKKLSRKICYALKYVRAVELSTKISGKVSPFNYPQDNITKHRKINNFHFTFSKVSTFG